MGFGVHPLPCGSLEDVGCRKESQRRKEGEEDEEQRKV